MSTLKYYVVPSGEQTGICLMKSQAEKQKDQSSEALHTMTNFNDAVSFLCHYDGGEAFNIDNIIVHENENEYSAKDYADLIDIQSPTCSNTKIDTNLGNQEVLKQLLEATSEDINFVASPTLRSMALLKLSLKRISYLIVN